MGVIGQCIDIQPEEDVMIDETTEDTSISFAFAAYQPEPNIRKLNLSPGEKYAGQHTGSRR